MTFRQHLQEFLVFAALWVVAQAGYQLFRAMLGLPLTIDTFSASVYWGLIGVANFKLMQAIKPN